jgi:VWFA-related protein
VPTSRVRLTSDATGVAILLCTAGLLAQQPRPIFRTEANFVRVDAFVTRDGVPVGDLTAADFDLLEDNVPQTIETFEHVVVRPAGPQETRADPDSQRQGNELAADPRRRVFVVFLDDYHVSVHGSHAMRKPLIALLDRVVGQDDLIGVMTPAMSAAGLTLGRKTQVLEGGLTDNWIWGRRFRITDKDPKEYEYEICYAQFAGGEQIAREMIARRRERLTLDALQDLVRHLRGLRDERKAIIAVSEGWITWRPHPNLARPLTPNAPNAQPIVPGQPEIFIGPGGKLRAGADPREPSASLYGCDADRQHLASLDNEQHFRDILDDANRANASFYPVDPRGLPVFDSPIGPDPPPDVITDARILRERLESLQTLAAATDGMAVMNSNDVDRGLKRMAADLTSYYLLGYYSTNPKLDGGFRSIKVRLKRPGLQVRARRGYRAATAEEVAAARLAAVPSPAAAAASATTGALTAALGRLSALRVDAPFQLHAVAARAGSGMRVWIAGELNAAAARTPEWVRGADASLLVNVRDGAGGSSRAAIEPNARSFLVSVPIRDGGEVHVQARVTPRTGDGRPIGQAVDIGAPAAGERAFAAAAPLLWRVSGGPAAPPRPAATFTFSRTERVRLELPLTPGSKGTGGRVLDRTGQPLDVPVTLSERRDAEDVWAVAEVNLAPLTAGDYAIEVAGERAGARETLITAIRVVR